MARKIKAPAAPATPAPELQVELENAPQVQTAPVAEFKEYTATKDIEADINNHKIKAKAGDKVQLKFDEAYVLKAYIKPE